MGLEFKVLFDKREFTNEVLQPQLAVKRLMALAGRARFERTIGRRAYGSGLQTYIFGFHL